MDDMELSTFQFQNLLHSSLRHLQTTLRLLIPFLANLCCSCKYCTELLHALFIMHHSTSESM